MTQEELHKCNICKNNILPEYKDYNILITVNETNGKTVFAESNRICYRCAEFIQAIMRS